MEMNSQHAACLRHSEYATGLPSTEVGHKVGYSEVIDKPTSASAFRYTT